VHARRADGSQQWCRDAACQGRSIAPSAKQKVPCWRQKSRYQCPAVVPRSVLGERSIPAPAVPCQCARRADTSQQWRQQCVREKASSASSVRAGQKIEAISASSGAVQCARRKSHWPQCQQCRVRHRRAEASASSGAVQCA
jgi:hypothetical protein